MRTCRYSLQANTLVHSARWTALTAAATVSRYTQPDEVYEVYKALSGVPNGRFTIAAAFGNVHGVYAPGNVKLTPQILHNSQKYIKEQEGGSEDKPVFFVFHGGSGSSREDIRYAIEVWNSCGSERRT